MKYIYSIFFVLIISCKKKTVAVLVEVQKSTEVQSIFEEKKTYVFYENIGSVIKEQINDWSEYFTLAEYLKENYSEVSPSESLEMSKELAVYVKAMKDSLEIKTLNNRGMFARLNTFNSEAIRLEDMSTIISIKANEVNEQVEKIVMVFNSINSKINAVYSQKKFDENIDFDEAIFNFNKAPEKPYSVPKRKLTRSGTKHKLLQK